MHPVRKQRLILVVFIALLSSAAIGLVLFAMRENLNLFYPPAKILAGEAPMDRTIRAGGCVVPGSIIRADDSLKIHFAVTDGTATLKASYQGILPDLFAEGEAAVLTGKLNDQQVFEATQVLAKHDETYTPSEVADSVAAEPGQNQSAICRDLFAKQEY